MRHIFYKGAEASDRQLAAVSVGEGGPQPYFLPGQSTLLKCKQLSVVLCNCVCFLSIYILLDSIWLDIN